LSNSWTAVRRTLDILRHVGFDALLFKIRKAKASCKVCRKNVPMPLNADVAVVVVDKKSLSTAQAAADAAWVKTHAGF